jgi:hypothetical protein
MRTAENIQKEASRPQNISVVEATKTIATAEADKQVDLSDLNLDLDGDDDFSGDLYAGL